MNRLIRLFSTSVGRELMMGVTGALLILYVTVHMLGNMKIFQGPDALNSYAAWLTGHPLLWLARIGLFTVFSLHVYLGISLARENSAARPRGYRYYRTLEASFASRHMLLSGLMVLAFVIYHLLHFTFGVIDAGHTALVDSQQRHDVYSMVVHGFQNPWISCSYIVAMLLLGMHLLHGAPSLFQSLGVNHESYSTLIRVACAAYVAIIVVGNCCIPILVLVGAVRIPKVN